MGRTTSVARAATTAVAIHVHAARTKWLQGQGSCTVNAGRVVHVPHVLLEQRWSVGENDNGGFGFVM